MEGFVALYGNDVSLSSSLELLRLLRFALLLQLAQLGGFFLATASQTRFLKLQIAELLLVLEERLQLDHARAQRGIVFGEGFGELDVAAGEDGGFQSGNAAQAPSRVRDGLHQIGFALPDGLELFLVGSDMALVFGGVVRGEENGATGEGGFDGIQR